MLRIWDNDNIDWKKQIHAPRQISVNALYLDRLIIADEWNWVSAVNYSRLTPATVNYRGGHFSNLLVFSSKLWSVNNNFLRLFVCNFLQLGPVFKFVSTL